MIESTLTVTDPHGLHARPAAGFVEEARRFTSRIEIRKGGESANAKSLVSILSLGIDQGTEITLVAEGPDEDRAMEVLRELVERTGHREEPQR